VDLQYWFRAYDEQDDQERNIQIKLLAKSFDWSKIAEKVLAVY